MDNRPDIWHHLRDHQTPPPPEVIQRLQQALSEINTDADRAAVPDGNGVGAPERLRLERLRLQRLQWEPIAPPAFLRGSILNAITRSEEAQPRGALRVFPKKWLYSGIAASLLLLLASVTVYKILTSDKPGSTDKNNTTAKITPIASSRTTVDTVKTSDSATATNIASAEDLPSAATDSISPAVTAKPEHWRLRLDGHSIRLVDNDPLFTFTSYHYPEMGNFMEQKAGEEIKISVDQYTNILVSKQAAAMIREMYKTRSNGKPTRKARKMKERLEAWKKADEKRFDSTTGFNPTDPLDLAEFIFK
jgi:hypothetical protein